MKPIVLLDCDGVLADFVQGALWEANAVTDRRHYKHQVTEWDFLKGLGLSSDETKKVMERVMERGFCQALPVLPGAQEGVATLQEISDVRVVTTPFDGAYHWIPERERWLDRHFGIKPKHVFHLHEKHHVRGDILVDDKHQNVAEWARAWPLGAACLWDAHHNQSAPLSSDYERIRSWDEVVKRVKARASL